MLSLLGGIFLGWSLGANDAANVFGPAVSSRMLKYRTAAITASVFVLLGAVMQGHEGIQTLSGLTRLNLSHAVVCSISAAFTVSLMTMLSFPVSTSQAVVGAILGVGLLNRQLDLGGLGKVLACWFGTPLGGMVLTLILYRLLAWMYNRLSLNPFQSDAVLRIGLVLVSMYGAYALGANNVANVTAVFVGAGRLHMPTALIIGGLSIGLGILTFSKGVSETVGRRLVRLDAFSALVVLFAGAVTVHFYSFVGVPVSTSQAVIGAVLGVGIHRGINTVRRKTLSGILIGWFLTPTVSSFIATLLAFATHLKYIPPQ